MQIQVGSLLLDGSLHSKYVRELIESSHRLLSLPVSKQVVYIIMMVMILSKKKSWKQQWDPICVWIGRPVSRFLEKAATTALLYENRLALYMMNVFFNILDRKNAKFSWPWVLYTLWKAGPTTLQVDVTQHYGLVSASSSPDSCPCLPLTLFKAFKYLGILILCTHGCKRTTGQGGRNVSES